MKLEYIQNELKNHVGDLYGRRQRKRPSYGCTRKVSRRRVRCRRHTRQH